MSDDAGSVPLGKAARREASPPRDPSLPTIKIVAGDLKRAVDEAESALIASGVELFQRSGTIVKPYVVEIPAADGGKTRSFRMALVSTSHVRELMGDAANFIKYDARAEAFLTCNCPKDVAEFYCAREGQWRLKPIAGVISAPLMRHDGSLLVKAGYDEKTGLLLQPGDTKFHVPSRPTREDALAALSILKGLFSSYPFANPASRSVALSGALTAIQRRALPTAPLHAYTSPSPGSGKSHAVDTTSVVATGEAAGVITQSRSEEETEKRLAAAILSGDAIISIDNCEFSLGGSFLCVAVSQPKIKARMLGQSLNLEVPSNSAIFATGNNLAIGGDMARRMLLCALDPMQERPELRAFDGDPIQTARRDRGKYVSAALTILRAFHLAGRPQSVRPIGSFEDWSALIRGALIWLGEPDPCETMEKTRSADAAFKALSTVMDQWETAAGVGNGNRKLVRELIAIANEQYVETKDGVVFKHADFREALIAVAGEGASGISSRRLGKWLLSVSGRIIGGRRFVQDGARAGVTYWLLDLVENG